MTSEAKRKRAFLDGKDAKLLTENSPPYCFTACGTLSPLFTLISPYPTEAEGVGGFTVYSSIQVRHNPMINFSRLGSISSIVLSALAQGSKSDPTHTHTLHTQIQIKNRVRR